MSEEKSDAVESSLEKGPVLAAFYGVKAGMMRIFDEQGNHVPVSVIQLIPNWVSQVKTIERDGYEAYQVAYGEKRERLLGRPAKGILSQAKIEKFPAHFFEVKTSGVDAKYLGQEVSLDAFSPAAYVDVTGVSKGKGFQGVIRRWNFSQGPLSHGSKFHRTGGSIGNRTTPGKVWKNKKMPGIWGAAGLRFRIFWWLKLTRKRVISW